MGRPESLDHCEHLELSLKIKPVPRLDLDMRCATLGHIVQAWEC